MSKSDRHLQGCGIGLRKEHHQAVLRERPAVPFFEVITENVLVEGGRPRHVLEQVRRDYPVALHGVSMSLGSAEPLDRRYLALLAELVDRIRPAIVSDHLSFTSLAGHSSHDLLPLPFTEEAVSHVARKIRVVQDVLGRRILVENVSTYLRFRGGEMDEGDFLAAVLEEADCDLLLDVNNLYVNARNHGLNPLRTLDLLPPQRVRQMHLAGHEDNGDVVIDTHDGPVCDAVWALYREAVERFGAVPTLIEWDARIPELPVVLREARLAERIQERAAAMRAARLPRIPSEARRAALAI